MRHAVLAGLVAVAGATECCRASGAEPAPPAAAQAAAPQDASGHFAVLEFRVLHNSVLGVRDVERAVYPHLGPDRTIADVQAARADLEKAYRAAGYSSVYVDIPEQQVADGVVRLAVTEGRVNRVTVSGTRYFLNRHIVAAVPSLAPGTVPHFPDVQNEINRLNQTSADLSVAPVLKPGPNPGTVDVDLKARDQLPLHASVELNNHYTPATSPLRLNVNLSYTNLFQAQQSLALGYQVAPQNANETDVYSVNYTIPFAPGGPSLVLYGVKTNSDVATVGTLSVVGKGNIYGGRYIAPFAANAATGFYQSVILGTDYKDFGQNVLLVQGGGLQTPIHYMNWSVAYDAAYITPHSHSTLDAAANFGISGIVNDPQEFEQNRFMAQPGYFYVRLDATHERLLTHGFTLALRLSGQYTAEPLIVNEQFAIGGADSVRGYLEAEALGDYGVSGALELRSPSLAPLLARGAHEAYAYLFTDAGTVALNEPLPSQDAHTNMWSFGGGMRLSSLAGLDMGFSVASAREATLYTHADGVRFLFDVRYLR